MDASGACVGTPLFFLKPDPSPRRHEEARREFKIHSDHDFEPQIMSLLFFVSFVVFVVRA
jgi:hypothetical protein